MTSGPRRRMDETDGDHNLAVRGDDLGEGRLRWSAARREGGAAWTVTVHWRSGGRAQRATWRFEPGTRTVSPRSTLAAQLARTAGGPGAAV